MLTTTLKISEAMREGAKMHPQGRLYYCQDGKTCALGAACIGAGATCEQLAKSLIVSPSTFWPDIQTLAVHPVKMVDMRLEDIIANLNDQYDWTRERIAAWLDTRGY